MSTYRMLYLEALGKRWKAMPEGEMKDKAAQQLRRMQNHPDSVWTDFALTEAPAGTIVTPTSSGLLVIETPKAA